MTLPKKIIRLDDGMEFLLNEETQLYRIHMGIPHLDDPTHLHQEYNFEQLMCRPDLFKVADGTEDIQSMKKRWMDEMDELCRENRGHGDGDD